MSEWHLNPGKLKLRELRHLLDGRTQVSIAPQAWAAVDASAAAVQAAVDRGEPLYGINTGFGKLAKTHIPVDQLAALQRNS